MSRREDNWAWQDEMKAQQGSLFGETGNHVGGQDEDFSHLCPGCGGLGEIAGGANCGHCGGTGERPRDKQEVDNERTRTEAGPI